VGPSGNEGAPGQAHLHAETGASAGAQVAPLRLGIVVRDRRFQRPFHTSMHLARAAMAAGGEVHLWGVGDLELDLRHRTCHAFAVRLDPQLPCGLLCHHLLEGQLPVERVDLSSLDLILLRFNPAAQDPSLMRWTLWWPALVAAMEAERQGVPVVNAPRGLLDVLTKLYLAQLPPEATIGGLATRAASSLERCGALGTEESQGWVAKPLVGSGGRGVFLLGRSDLANRDQILETVFAGGYGLLQPFVAAGLEHGDKRVLLVDGAPLVCDGRVAVYRRRGGRGRLRNNMHAGGRREAATLDELDRRSLAAVAPWVRSRGLRFVGVDLLAGRVLEINAFCPGGIENMNALYGVDLAPVVLERLAAAPRDASDCLARNKEGMP